MAHNIINDQYLFNYDIVIVENVRIGEKYEFK
jgi:hypothetical protein